VPVWGAFVGFGDAVRTLVCIASYGLLMISGGADNLSEIIQHGHLRPKKVHIRLGWHYVIPSFRPNTRCVLHNQNAPPTSYNQEQIELLWTKRGAKRYLRNETLPPTPARTLPELNKSTATGTFTKLFIGIQREILSTSVFDCPFHCNNSTAIRTSYALTMNI